MTSNYHLLTKEFISRTFCPDNVAPLMTANCLQLSLATIALSTVVCEYEDAICNLQVESETHQTFSCNPPTRS